MRRIPAGSSWSGRTLSLEVSSSAKPGTRVYTDALILDTRWRRHRRFEPPPAG